MKWNEIYIKLKNASGIAVVSKSTGSITFTYKKHGYVLYLEKGKKYPFELTFYESPTSGKWVMNFNSNTFSISKLKKVIDYYQYVGKRMTVLEYTENVNKIF